MVLAACGPLGGSPAASQVAAQTARPTPTPANSSPAAAAVSMKHGMDNECADFFTITKDDHDYRPFIDAVHQGLMSEADLDRSLKRLFTARMRLGMFDPPNMVPYANTPASEIDSPEHRQLALKTAQESMVLLKNDGVLPLKSFKNIAVVGPLAEQTAVLLGNYNGTPTHTTSVLEGMKAEFPGAKITYVAGTQFLSQQGDPVPASALTAPDGKTGLKVEYSSRPGENVLDLFGGSGSTLIAAEQSGRTAFLMELDPPYADVIVQRFVNFSGGTDVRPRHTTSALRVCICGWPPSW